MSKYIFFIVIFFITSCDNKKNEPPTGNPATIIEEPVNIGFVDLYTTSKNNSFLFYQLGVADIWLIEKNGALFNVKDIESTYSGSIDLTFAREESKHFFRMVVPEEEYTGIIFAFDYSFPATQILSIKDNKESEPYIFNAFFQELINDNHIQKLTVHFPTEKKLAVSAGETTQLSLLFDVDASMRLMPAEDKIDADQFLVTPSIEIKQAIHHPNKVIYEGLLQTFDGQNIQIIPTYSQHWLQPYYTLSTHQNTTYRLNHETIDLSTLVQKYSSEQDTHRNILIHCAGHYVDSHFIADDIFFFEASEEFNAILHGFLYSDYFIGRATSLSQTNGHSQSGYYAQTITNSAIDKSMQSFIGYVSAQGNNKQTKIDVFNQLPTHISGKVTAINQENIELEIANIAGIDGKFIHNNKTAKVILSDELSDFISVGTPIKATGKFTDSGVFHASSMHSLLNSELRYRLSLPLINANPVLKINNEHLSILKNNGVDFLELAGEEISFPNNLPPIEKIDIKNSNFILLTERRKTHPTINYYETPEAFLNTLQSRHQEGYRENAIIADGNYNDSLFTSRTLTLTLYAPTELDLLDESIINTHETTNAQTLLKGEKITATADTLKLLFKGAAYASKYIYKKSKFIKDSLFFYINKKAFIHSIAQKSNATRLADTKNTVRRIRKKDMRKIAENITNSEYLYNTLDIRTQLTPNETDNKYLNSPQTQEAKKSYQAFLGIRKNLFKEPFQLSSGAQKTLANTLSQIKTTMKNSSGQQLDLKTINALSRIDDLLKVKAFKVITPKRQKR